MNIFLNWKFVQRNCDFGSILLLCYMGRLLNNRRLIRKLIKKAQEMKKKLKTTPW